METQTNPKNQRPFIGGKKLVLVVAALLVVGGLFGWFLGRSNKTDNTQPVSQDETSTNAGDITVKSLISYTLPDGWREASCEEAIGIVYVIPEGAGVVDCDANPSAPIKLAVDPGETKDCNELQNVQNVKRHVCISLYINGQRSLKASTEYLPSSSFGKAITFDAYYIDTGGGVIKSEYTYESVPRYQVGFDQLVNSITTKN